VLIADIDVENGQRVANEIGDAALFFEIDTSSAEQNEAMVQKAVDAFGGLDIAVNNAGIGGPQAPTGEYPLDGWRQVIGINLDGVFYGMRYQIPAMLNRGGGSIVNMASILGSVGFATSPAYVAAKHAVVGLSKNAAIEYSAKGIRVNSIGPGFIRTPLIESALDEATLEMLAGMHPIGRLGRPEEVAALVAFLASDDASFITGSYNLVDGAYTSQ
jgi:NAD(P)-dependent dehydrogenase (short-subunit alcohol dehydrogenase family)